MEINNANILGDTQQLANSQTQKSSTQMEKASVSTTSQKSSNISDSLSVELRKNTGNSVRAHVQNMLDEEVDQKMKDLVKEINSKLKTNTEINYSVHDETDRLNIKIIDKDTKKVITEWPSEKSLDILAKLIDKEALLFDRKL